MYYKKAHTKKFSVPVLNVLMVAENKSHQIYAIFFFCNFIGSHCFKLKKSTVIFLHSFN